MLYYITLVIGSLAFLYYHWTKSRPRDLRSQWDTDSHEYGVEELYNHGIQKLADHDYHGGYLNFGYWIDKKADYLAAAKALVFKMACSANLTKDSYLLDVACGLGVQDFDLHTMVGCKIDAMDLSHKHIEIAKNKLKSQDAAKQQDIKFLNCSATDMKDVTDNTYTHVMCIEGGPHMNTRVKFLEEAHRVLKPGGTLCIADILLNREPENAFENMFKGIAEKLWHAPAENSYDQKRLENYMLALGYTDIKIEDISDDVIPGYYKDRCTAQAKRECAKVRGWVAAYPGHIIDFVLAKIFQHKIAKYVIVTAQKKAK
jgi:2-polyprenyl-3-methyl-5-hydroxy-6-metoxy-1,4-benzoquinol methylase